MKTTSECTVYGPDINEKRFYVNAVFTWTCPKCGAENKYDFSCTDYFLYGEPREIDYCGECGDDFDPPLGDVWIDAIVLKTDVPGGKLEATEE